MVEGDTEAGGAGGRGSGPAAGGGRAGTELARCRASGPAAARASAPARRESENFLRLRLSAASADSGCSGPPRVLRSGLRCESLPESERSLPLNDKLSLNLYLKATSHGLTLALLDSY